MADAMTGPAEPAGRRQVARSVLTLSAGELINKATRFGAVVVLARELPLDQYGLLNVGVAVGGIAVVVLRLGLPDLGSRDAAIAPERREDLAARVITPQLAGLFVALLAALALLVAVAPGSVPFAAAVAFSALGLSMSGDWLLRGMGRMSALATATAAGGATVLAASVLAGRSGTAVAGLLALGAGELAAAALTWRAAGLRHPPRPRLEGLRPVLRESWPLAIAGLVTYAYYANLDTVLLAATRSSAEAGLYSAPYRVFLALNAVGLFAAYGLLPLVSREVSAGRVSAAERLVAACIAPLAAFGLVALGLSELAGEPLLRALFGARFAAMDTTFVLLCIALPWYCMGYPVAYSALARGRQKQLLTGAALAAACNLVLNVALIPPLGTEGAATSTAVAMMAGALAWLASAGMLARAGVTVAAVTAASVLGVSAALAPGTARAAGATTLGLATAVFALSVGTDLRRLAALRRGDPDA